jgi:hypothetical protein
MQNSTIASVNLARSELSAATTRIDSVVRDVGVASGRIEGLSSQINRIEVKSDLIIAKLEVLQRSAEDHSGKINSIELRVLAERPFEQRVIESYGITVDEDIYSNMIDGVIVAFPRGEKKRNELLSAGFTASSRISEKPFRAFGFNLPSTARWLPRQPSTGAPPSEQRVVPAPVQR